MSMAALIRQMTDAGAPIEAVLIAVEAIEAAQAALEAVEQAKAERRARDAARSLRRRAMLPADWEKVRVAVFERDNWTCRYCGTREAEQWHCDHVVPLCRGGGNDWDNLVTSCRSCNSSKGGKTLIEWAAS